MNIQFANREDELKDICNSASQVMVIDTPPGFGKTYLLKKAKSIFEKGEGDDRTWGCAYLDMGALDYHGDASHHNINTEIARQVTKNNDINIESYEHLIDGIRMIPRILFIFDSFERATDEIRIYVLDKLIGTLSSLFGIDRFKVIIAERHSAARREVTDPKLKLHLLRESFPQISLQPFLAKTVVEILKKTYASMDAQHAEKPEEPSQATYEKYARGIVKLSGGQPKTIANLVTELAKGWLEDYDDESRREILFDRCVKDEIEAVLNGVPANIVDDLKNLSVFRFFVIGTIEMLMLPEFGIIDEAKDSFVLLKQLLATGLVKPVKLGYNDGVIRNLILTEMRIKNKSRYLQLNDVALRVYKFFIEDALKNKKSPSVDFTNRVPQYIQECIYHLTQLNLDNHQMIVRIRAYYPSLMEIGVSTDKDCYDEIMRMFGRDNEIVTELGEIRAANILNLLSSGEGSSSFHAVPSVRSNSPSSFAPPPIPARKPIEIFFSYSHQDEDSRKELEKHLKMMQREGLIESWYDRKIEAGAEWEPAIRQHLNQAQIILLLISPDFLASDYCYDEEVKRAVERHERGEATVIPIILRTSRWKKTLFGKLQALPSNAEPIANWSRRDDAFHDVAQGIEATIQALLRKTS